MLSNKTPCNKKAVVVTVPGIHASYSVAVSGVQTESLEPKLIHSWIQARQKNHKVRVKDTTGMTLTSPHTKDPTMPAKRMRHIIDGEVGDNTPRMIDEQVCVAQKMINRQVHVGIQRKLPPIVSLYTPSSPSTHAQRKKTLYSSYMDNLISPGQNSDQRSRLLKWEGHYKNKEQELSNTDSPLSYDFINFIGSPISSKQKYLESLRAGKMGMKTSESLSKESTEMSLQESRSAKGQLAERDLVVPSKRPSPDHSTTDNNPCENETGTDEGSVLDSMTLPCIEEILRSEGIEEFDIAQQLRFIKDDELKTFIKSHDFSDSSGEEKKRFPRLNKVSVNMVSKHETDRQMETAHRRELNPFLNGQIRDWLQSFKHKQHLAMLRHSRVPEIPLIISKSPETNSMNSNIPMTTINVPNHFWPRVVLVANNIPRSDLLVNTVLHRRNDLITIHYAFDSHSLPSLLRDIQKRLQTYHEKWNTTAIRSLLVVCNGGPGYFHIVKGKPITTQVLQKDDSIDVTVFLKGISALFSHSGSYFHMMGCDAFPGKLGKQFLSLLEKKLSHSSVQVEQLDNRPGHQQTLKLYMDPKQYRRWTERVVKLHNQ